MKKIYLLLAMLAGGGMAQAQTCGTTISTFPHIQDFETSTAGAPGTLPTGWTTSPTSGYRWEIQDGPVTSLNTGPATDHTTGILGGKYPYTESSSGSTGDASFLVSPCFNIASLTSPGFDFWYHMYGATMGSLEVQVSNNNGATWTTLTTITGQQQTASSDPWIKRTVSLAGQTGTVQIRFRGIRGTSFTSDMAIDDFKIYNIPPIDAELVAITAPAISGCGFTATENVTISIKNNGNTAITSIPVRYQIGTGSPVNETASVNIAPGATANYTFTTKANLATPGTYTLTTTALLTGDGDPSNDAKTRTITVVPNVATFPYFQNFESGNGGWVAGGTSSSWALGTPANPVINSAASGTNAWITNLTGNYNASENSYVQGPCFNFSSLSAPIIEMKVWWNAEFSWDGAVLQSSFDGGVTWQNVGAFGDPNNWYTDNTINGAPGGQPTATAEGWSGRASTNNGSNGWVLAKHVLNGLGNQPSVLLRIAFGSDGSVHDDGFAFDDVRIFDTPANDAGVTAVISPVTPVTPGVSQPVQVTIKNFGTAALTSAQVGFSVNGVVVANNVPFTGNLALNQSSTPFTVGNYTFPAGNFTLKAWTRLPNNATDGNDGNDTTAVNIISCNSLSGTYTINKNMAASATNFQSVTAAANTLNSCGISAPVTFNVVANTGPYNGQVVLNQVPGASATNTITFNGNGNTIVANPGGTNLGIITLDGADYAKFDNFILNLDAVATTGWGVQLMNEANGNTIMNTTMNLPLTSTSSNFNGIGFGSSISTADNNGSNNTFSGNTINGGYYAVRVNGATGGTGAVNNQFVNNTIKDNYIYNFYLSNTNGTLIEGNDVSRPTRGTVSSFYGVYMTGANQGVNISKNRFHNAFGGLTSTTSAAYVIYLSSTDAPVGSENVIKNNLIYDINTNGTIYAFYNIGSDGAHYFYNTVDLSNATSTGTVRGVYQTTTASNIKIQNNIFTITTAASGAKTGLYFNATASSITSNNNVIYVPVGDVGYYSSAQNTLALWKTVNSGAFDQNSVSADPQYVDYATGNLKPTNVAVNNIGAPITGITTDITGATRSTTTPDPGAYEFTVNPNDVGITAVTGAASGCNLTANQSITITVKNFGSAPQSNIPVNLLLNNTVVGTGTIAGPLAPNATATFTFTTTLNLSAPGPYAIVANTLLTGDADASNDSFTLNVTNALIPTLPIALDFETPTSGIGAVQVVTNANSTITEATGGSNGAGSTKGMIMAGIDNAGWQTPVGVVNPWTSNPDHFSAVKMCINPSAGPAKDSLFLIFDLKQLYKGAAANTNFRVTVNGQQIGNTYNPPFGGPSTTWQRIRIDLTPYKNLSNLEIALESSVKEEYANGNGTANLIDNMILSRRTTGLNSDVLAAQISVYPNPSTGLFKVDAPKGNYTLEVLDLTGKTILKQNANGAASQLNLKDAAKGIYMLKITSEGSVATKRLVIE